MIFRVLSVTLFLPLFTGCGGAGSTAVNEADEPVLTAPATAPVNHPATAAGKPAEPEKPDEQAIAADAWCRKAVESSAAAPVEMLEKKDINACLVAIRPVIRKDCSQGVKKEIILKIIIAKDGSVTGAIPTGDAADSTEARCIVDRVKAVTFPAFTAKDTLVIEKYPFALGE